ncbi:glycoside hydrolase/deacetylase [Meredithblackwellia eburnea MCA 4105]
MEQQQQNPDWPPRNFKGYGKDGIDPKWPGGARIAVSLCLNYEEGGEYEVRLGDAHGEFYLGEVSGRPGKKVRDPSIESEFEYGARAGVWRILRIFDELKLKCTVWGVGKAIERNPDVAKEMIASGHEIAGHGYRWIDYSKVSYEEEAAHVGAMIDGLTHATNGVPPAGYYVGRHSLDTLKLLSDAHRARGIPLLYSSDTYSDDLPYWVPRPGGTKDEGLLMIPYALDTNDFKFGIANGFGSPDDFYSYLRAAFDYLYEEGRSGRPTMMSIGLHGRISGKPARAFALRRFIEYMLAQPDEGVWIATRAEIAEHWAKTHPYVPES